MTTWSNDDNMTTQELTPRETSRELRRLSVSVDKVTKYLFGNGEKGMDELLRDLDVTVRNLQTSFESYKSDRKKQEDEKEKQKLDDRIWLKRLVIASAIPYALSFIVWIVYWYTKLQPLLEQLETQVK